VASPSPPTTRVEAALPETEPPPALAASAAAAASMALWSFSPDFASSKAEPSAREAAGATTNAVVPPRNCSRSVAKTISDIVKWRKKTRLRTNKTDFNDAAGAGAAG